MSDFSNINLYGVKYEVKDSTARTEIQTTREKLITIEYDSETETINVTKANEIEVI